MAYAHITASGATAPAVLSGNFRKALVVVNTAYPYAISLSDSATATGAANLASVTGAAAGTTLEYWDIDNGISISTPVNPDITISVDGSFGPK